MKLTCCGLRPFVGIVTISVETGISVERLRKVFTKRNIRASSKAEFFNCNIYDSRVIQDLFRDYEPEYPT